MDDPRLIAEVLHRAADSVARFDVVPDWVDAFYRDKDMRSTDEIAHIFERSPDTIRRRAEASAAEGYPLGIMVAGVWLLSLNRCLRWVQEHQGQHARLIVEDRIKENANLRLKPQTAPEIVPDAVMTAS